MDTVVSRIVQPTHNVLCKVMRLKRTIHPVGPSPYSFELGKKEI